jgi:hypothetical protein
VKFEDGRARPTVCSFGLNAEFRVLDAAEDSTATVVEARFEGLRVVVWARADSAEPILFARELPRLTSSCLSIDLHPTDTRRAGLPWCKMREETRRSREGGYRIVHNSCRSKKKGKRNTEEYYSG